MAEQVTRVRCGWCHKTLTSNRPIPVGTTVRCPSCGQQFPAEPIPERTAVASTVAATAGRTGRSLANGQPSPMVTSPLGLGQLGHDDSPRPGYGRGLGSGSAPAPDAMTPRSWPLPSPPPGAPRIEGYTILGELGRGGMGVVYKARHEKLKRVVALKIISVDRNAGAYYLSHFQAEAEVVARLHHPNIIQIFEVGEQDGRPYLALEFATGGTLKQRLDGQPQPVRAAAQLVEILARAVHAAHLRGVVHLDLKPANILLENFAVGEDRYGVGSDHLEAAQVYGVPKVTDFGLARRMFDDLDPSQYGMVSGTPLYMAPEQIKAQVEDVGPATDVYALGNILYEMLTGRPPFFSKTAADVFVQVVSDPPVPPRQVRPQIPRDLEAICLKCLEKEPRRRYRSAMALAEDLQQFLDDQPIRARSATLPERAWSWCLRNPVPSCLLLTATVLLAVGQWSLVRLSDTLVEKTALEGAAQQTEMLREMNKLYTDVSATAKKAGIELTHRFPDDEKPVLPIPARFTILLGERVQRHADEEADREGHGRNFMRLQMYSNHPFRERPDSPPKHKFGVDALKHYETTDNKVDPFYRFDKFNGLRVLRYATPMIMAKRCLVCHNDKEKYPALTKTDWKVGDVRGVLEIVYPLDESYDQTRSTLFQTYMLLGTLAVILLAFGWIGLNVGKKSRGR